MIRRVVVGGVFLLLLTVLVSAPSLACTIFFATDGTVCLVGNNEDWFDPNTNMWFVPGDEGKLGVIYFGFGNFWPQGGMNEAGLFFDATATPYQEIRMSAGKPWFEGNLLDKIMRECASVREALAVLDHYSLEDSSFNYFSQAQHFFADAHGDAAVVEGDLVLTRKERYMILTNFRQSQHSQGNYPCWRYNVATKLLSGADRISVDLFRDVLDATHQRGSYPTQYSNIYDLQRKVVYLYWRHNFDKVLVFDLREELKKGARRYRIEELFQ